MAYSQKHPVSNSQKGGTAMRTTNAAKKSSLPSVWRRVVRVGVATSGLAVVLAGAAAGPAIAVPGETRQVHVEGQLVPMGKSAGVYQVTGGLVGTYRLQREQVVNAWTYWATQIRDIEGIASFKGCLDQNQNQDCDANEPSGELRLTFSRVASFDLESDRLIEGESTLQISSSGRFSGGVLTTRNIPVHNTDQIVSTYQGDLEVVEPRSDSNRAD
jgi:hypothetical protein